MGHKINHSRNIKMITKNSTITAIAIALLTTSSLNAFEFYNPFSSCNAEQSKIMKNKCDRLSGKDYKVCERETLKQFFNCVKGANDGK